MSRRRHQKGRKPQKAWHRRGAGRRFLAAIRGFPDAPATPYDGAPTPLRQGHAKRGRLDS